MFWRIIGIIIGFWIGMVTVNFARDNCLILRDPDGYVVGCLFKSEEPAIHLLPYPKDRA